LGQAVDPARRALDELLAYFDRLIAERRAQPQSDLISAMAAPRRWRSAQPGGAVRLCVFLYVAGHETTVSLLGSGTLALLQHPEQFDRLRADPDGLVEGAVEEFLRFESRSRGPCGSRRGLRLAGRRISQGRRSPC